MPYSPLSCISDHPVVPSPCMPPRTPDCFAVPSVGQSSSVKTPESVSEATCPVLQKAVSASEIVQPLPNSNFDVKCSPPMPLSQNRACTDDVAAGNDSVNKKMAYDCSRSAVSVPMDFLLLSMMNVFNSEEQKNKVIDDVSTW